MKDAAPAAASQFATDRRQQRARDIASRFGVQRRCRRRVVGALASRLLRYERLRLLDDDAEGLVAVAGGVAPNGEAVFLHHERNRAGRRPLGISLCQPLRQWETGAHVLKERDLLPEYASRILLRVRRVGQRESRDVVRVSNEASGQESV